MLGLQRVHDQDKPITSVLRDNKYTDFAADSGRQHAVGLTSLSCEGYSALYAKLLKITVLKVLVNFAK